VELVGPHVRIGQRTAGAWQLRAAAAEVSQILDALNTLWWGEMAHHWQDVG